MAEDDGTAPAISRALPRRARRPARDARAGPLRLLRRLLLSEYFVLYLTIAYFARDGGVLPALVTPRNITNQLSNVWPLLAVAIGQTFVIIIAGIDLSQGAIMGFASVAGAVVMTSAADQRCSAAARSGARCSSETGGLLAGRPDAVAVGRRGDARRRRA